MPEQGPRMNGFSLGELCWLFCCPPCPSRIAAKLAFLPPEPTYSVHTDAEGACSLRLTERADWQYSQRELDAVEVFGTRTTRGNRVLCMFVRCAPGSRYTLLFSHGNAVDLGQMCSFYIGLGSRINCNVFSYDYSGYGVSTGKPSEKNLYADIEAAWQVLRTKNCDNSNPGHYLGRIKQLAICMLIPHVQVSLLPEQVQPSIRVHVDGNCGTVPGLLNLESPPIRYGVTPENIILYGQSIGTVPTVDLAARYECAAVILHSPLMSGLRVAFPDTRKTYCFDAFPSYLDMLLLLDKFQHVFFIDKVSKVASPVLVIHGTEDEVIDFSHGLAIYERCPRAVEPLWVEGAGHNDIELYAQYLERLKQFISFELATS
ncbi:hypothetical protein QTP70_013609 [Hemibagrus guttatus]|uniref:Alpha/beta hydrolase domain-containing protein 17C n=1 Tax=Hemibagrus guttatus TaxID=175788 RepID=A0AAE0QUI8_9TELE|nr:hypothetical protein QTP70_013609 [Hemibagrus guttatus]